MAEKIARFRRREEIVKASRRFRGPQEIQNDGGDDENDDPIAQDRMPANGDDDDPNTDPDGGMGDQGGGDDPADNPQGDGGDDPNAGEDPDDGNNPVARRFERRGGREVSKAMADKEGGDEEQIAVMNGEDFTKQLLTGISKAVADAVSGDLIRKIIREEVAKAVSPVTQLVKGMSGTVDDFIDHVDDRLDLVDAHGVELAKSITTVTTTLEKGVIPASATPAVDPKTLTPAPAGHRPVVIGGGEPLEKGVIPGTNGPAPVEPTQEKQVIALIEKAEKLQEDTGKPVMGLSDVVMTTLQGHMPSPRQIETVREGIADLEAARK